jgi:uncharacterized membrane protein YfcA
LQPIEAVPLMMACSVGVQATNLWALRQSVRWKESFVMVLGGVFGIPVAIWLLHNIDPGTFRQCFGMTVCIYAGYMLFRPKCTYVRQVLLRRNALIGFGGGLIGGLTAMPGALPTIWCDMHGMPKDQQRGLVQPFIAIMQLSALLIMFSRQDLSSAVFFDFLLSVPFLVAGSTLGILAFHNLTEVTFRRIILAILLVSGLALLA